MPRLPTLRAWLNQTRKDSYTFSLTVEPLPFGPSVAERSRRPPLSLLVIFMLECRSDHEMSFSHLTRQLVCHELLGERVCLCAMNLLCVRRRRGSQEAAGEQIELGAAKHLSFDHLQAIDVPLYWPRAPGQRQASFDCVEVATKAFGQPLEGPESALRGLREPLLQAVGTPASQQVGKGLA